MARSISTLTIIVLTSLTLGAAAHYAQTTPPSPSNCGVETWSTEIDGLCRRAVHRRAAEAARRRLAPGATPCGVETWSTDKMAYVGTPCPAGITYENPASPTK